MKKLLLSLAGATALAIPAAPAMAQGGPPPWAPAHGYRDNNGGYDRCDRYERKRDRRACQQDRRRYSERRYRQQPRYSVYNDRGWYNEPRRVRRGDRIWEGRDGRYYCRRDNGTTGLIIGAAGGALIGREIDGGRDRTAGTIIGAAIGGLLGREIDRGGARCR